MQENCVKNLVIKRIIKFDYMRVNEMYYCIRNDEGKFKKFSCGIEMGTELTFIKVDCDCCKRTWNKVISNNDKRKATYVFSNQYFPDFMYAAEGMLVSSKAKEILEIHQIRQLHMQEVKALSLDELSAVQKKVLRDEYGINLNHISSSPPTYFSLDVSHGATYHKNSNLVEVDHCDCCGHGHYVTNGLDWVEGVPILSRESLMNYDIFMAKGYGASLFTNARFKWVYDQYNLTGLIFEEISAI